MTDQRIVIYEGDVVRHLFRLRLYDRADPPNLDAATAIVVSVEDSNGAAIDPIPCVRTTEGADWSVGDIVVEFTPSNITSTPGTYRAGARISIDGQTLVWDHVTVEVRDTPGYPYPS